MSSFAVIKTGGKQYKVSKGDLLKIEKMKDEHKAGDKLTFDKVLLKGDDANVEIGTPMISGAKVEATVKEVGKSKKVKVIRYKAKSRYLKKNGHRQPFLKVEVGEIK